MDLVIVESPAKAKTIKRYLGSSFAIRATFGHVRDLPKKSLGIDIEGGFKPQYLILPRSKKIISQLKGIGKEAKNIYIACDFDREGEAIGWHIVEACGFNKEKNRRIEEQKKVKRITFVEITKEAISQAIKNPREIDLDLVDAQQARRILDRLVGYKLSPLLWRKIKSRLSAGRVQSVALRLIMEREKEIEEFKPEEYWEIEAEFEKKSKIFKAKLIKEDNKKIKIKNEKEASHIVSNLKKADFEISKIRKAEIKKYPPPPFITSTLQQEAFYKLGFSAQRTMRTAQELYEGVALGPKGRVGLITYLRTDSFNLSQLALNSTRKYIGEKFGPSYLPKRARIYKKKVLQAQEAHEAIRPTYIKEEPSSIKKYLSPDQYKLYKLIWQRMVACQMTEASFEETTVNIKATRDKGQATNYLLEAKGLKNLFPGYLKIYQERLKETILPPLREGEKLKLVDLFPLQKFTQPLPRYTEATLVKTLEEWGIGRPSTYAPILSTIQRRGYTRKEGRFLLPTEIGRLTNDLLVAHFPEIVDFNFTSKMEEELDKIAEDKMKWTSVVRKFYNPFSKHLQTKYEEIKKIKISPQRSEEVCSKCGKPMVIREGRYGKFLACSGFPQCKNTKPITLEVKIPCPYCGSKIIQKKVRRGKVKGKIFYGCSNYPQCKFASWQEPTEYRCSKCDFIMGREGKILTCLRCKNKEVLKS